MRRLVILRHAQAEDGEPGQDFARRLTGKGRQQAALMGRWLANQEIVPDRVVSSPAPRALETARIACRELGLDPGGIVQEPTVYDAATPTLLRLLSQQPAQSRCVLLAGHNPGLEELAVHLTGDDDLAKTGLRKAGIVAVQMPDDWQDLGAKASDSWLRADPDSV